MSYIQSLILLSVLTFLLHGIWEYLHIVLYTGYEAMKGILPLWVLVTLGDVLYTLLAVCFISLSKSSLVWLKKVRLTDYLTLGIVGFVIALFVEYKGLYLGRWSYLPSMPIVPLLGVGLSPLIQMTLLLPLSVFLQKHIGRILGL